MTSQAEPEKKISDNKAVFGPLGRYAVIAVIMVSIIITTVILLDKQLGTVDEKLASIESEVAELYTNDEVLDETEPAVAAIIDVKEEATSSATADIKEETVITPQTETIAKVELEEPVEQATVTEVIAVINEDSSPEQQATAVESPVTQLSIVQPTVMQSPVPEAVQIISPVITAANNLEKQVSDEQPLSVKSKSYYESHQADNATWDKQIQARIEASKLEQKQHMTAMFERIKNLESKQLEQYKESQEQQIVHLREQISQQHEMIETLISRNKNLFGLRAANIQRHQEHRELMLNRI